MAQEVFTAGKRINLPMGKDIKDSKDIWTVSSLTASIKSLVEREPSFCNLWVKGEVSDFKEAYSGHCYFKLKDSRAVLGCVMFKSRAERLSFKPEDGQMVMARGSITLYERGGNYQLMVEDMRPEGLGEMFVQFLKLKEELQKKGYFAIERKRDIPFIPGGIGIATSPRGAGLQDMIKIIRKRFPPCPIYLCPTTVQGSDAPQSIAASISLLNALDRVDVLIVGRGGGSFEDLNCFNHPLVADAIYHSRKPVISAVGHETDFTICDMVADVRAETPTAAAQMVVPDRAGLKDWLQEKKKRLTGGLMRLLENRRARMEGLTADRMSKIVMGALDRRRQDLDQMWEKLCQRHAREMERKTTALLHAGQGLKALSPQRVLQRGYAAVRDPATGRFVGRGRGLAPGDALEILFADGMVKGEAKSRLVEGNGKLTGE